TAVRRAGSRLPARLVRRAPLLDDQVALHQGPVAGERAVEGVGRTGGQPVAGELHAGGLAPADDRGVGDDAFVAGGDVVVVKTGLEPLLGGRLPYVGGGNHDVVPHDVFRQG